MATTNIRAAKFLGGLLLASSALATWPTHAQIASSRVAASPGIEEIIVTARKREESLQQVPVAVTAITSDQLREQSIKEAFDLPFHAPGLMLRSGSGTRQVVDFFIRGQGPTAGSAPAVVVYFADAPVQPFQPNGSLGDNGQFFDLADIQVLKGPQGTLFGRSTTGGAVLYSPARPTNDFEASIDASAGNLGYQEFNGFVNVPLFGDKLAMRISANSVRRNGFTTSIVTGQQLDDRHRDSFRVGLSFKPTEWLSNYLMFQDTRVSEAGPPIHRSRKRPGSVDFPIAVTLKAFASGCTSNQSAEIRGLVTSCKRFCLAARPYSGQARSKAFALIASSSLGKAGLNLRSSRIRRPSSSALNAKARSALVPAGGG
jgi:iron complex outermembrane receptor protein